MKIFKRLGFAKSDKELWTSRVYDNLSQLKGMTIRVQGPPGNPNAIESEVTLIDEKSKQSRHYYVGWSDHSRFSQTFLDIYVTKTNTESNVTFKIEYPDGKNISESYDTSEVDKLLIEYR